MNLANPHEDCEYWGLTRLQCARHHLRLAEYYVRLTGRSVERAEVAVEKSKRSYRFALGFLGFSAGLSLAILALEVLS